MSVWLDKKYLNILSPRLPMFEWKNDSVANCRCPICGDSQKNKRKKRGYFYNKNSGIKYKCQNCGTPPIYFSKFLKEFDESLYKEYMFEKFQDENQSSHKPAYKKAPNFDQVTFNGLISVKDLPDTHICKKYVMGRKIPEKHWDKLFYCAHFQKWVNTQIPDKFDKIVLKDQRLVIPFYNKSGKVYAYQGRALYKTDLRYITINEHDNVLLYGLERVDLKKQIYLCEGPVDSLFIDNCLAAAGSSLKKMLNSKMNLVYIFDNERRSKTILKLMEDVIKLGKSIVIWPNSIDKKDINDMILKGLDVDSIIKNNTYSGLVATLKFNEWKKN